MTAYGCQQNVRLGFGLRTPSVAFPSTELTRTKHRLLYFPSLLLISTLFFRVHELDVDGLSADLFQIVNYPVKHSGNSIIP